MTEETSRLCLCAMFQTHGTCYHTGYKYITPIRVIREVDPERACVAELRRRRFMADCIAAGRPYV